MTCSSPRYSRRTAALLAALFMAATAPSAFAQAATTETAVMNAQTARLIVAPFYDMLNQPASKDLRALAETVIAPGWRSFAGENNSKGREEFVGQLGAFGKLIPDLRWEIKEVLVAGDRVVVRSEASGTPVGPFLGVAHGGKSFRIMTIDVHTVRDGKLIEAHHVEDWAGAVRQLSAK
jgi:predicted ester cyclase